MEYLFRTNGDSSLSIVLTGVDNNTHQWVGQKAIY